MFSTYRRDAHKLTIYKVSRLSDPLGAPLASLLVFGPQLLALTADGRRLLVWDTAQEGSQSVLAM